MKIILTIILSVLALTSCQDSKRDEDNVSKKVLTKDEKKERPEERKEEPEKKNDEVLHYTYKTLFEEETLNQGKGLSIDAKSGDTLIIRARGKMFAPTFRVGFVHYGEFYPHQFAYYCLDRSLKPDYCPDDSYFNFYPHCRLEMRYYSGMEEREITFSQNQKETDLRLKVGNQFYSLKRIMFHDDEITVSMQIPQDAEGEIELVIMFASPPLGKIGLLGFNDENGECPIDGMKQDKVYAPFDYEDEVLVEGKDGMPSFIPELFNIKTTVEYIVTVEVKSEVRDEEI